MRIGFKKNVNRATTQVMMKTGESGYLPRRDRWPLRVLGPERGLMGCAIQGMWRGRMTETMRSRSGMGEQRLAKEDDS